jgi:hypothetical protein
MGTVLERSWVLAPRPSVNSDEIVRDGLLLPALSPGEKMVIPQARESRVNLRQAPFDRAQGG